ncbi:hypothetical protein BIWAKO_04641 [Bosea sp. BIWAKO-01]|nr:hypothetical protein BIWAKO_04641 [Bosea sp. BIWAKO-01]
MSAAGQRERLAAVITDLWAEDPTVDLPLMAVRRFNETAPKMRRGS